MSSYYDDDYKIATDDSLLEEGEGTDFDNRTLNDDESSWQPRFHEQDDDDDFYNNYDN